MPDLKGLRLTQKFKQFPGFGCFATLAFQFHYPRLLRAQALLTLSHKVFGANNHFFDHLRRMGPHVGYITQFNASRSIRA